MRIRTFALICCLAAGCSALNVGPNPSPPVEPETRGKEPAGPPDVQTAKFEELPASPSPLEDELGRAAICIEKGDNSGAVSHFSRHLHLHPEQIMIRAYLAEVHLKMKNLPEAQHQFERFIADAQQATGPAKKHILHCHTRLMEIAQERDDAYGEHLHRGIGMVLLARQLDGAVDGADVEPGFRERLLCKAVAELNRAKKLRPDEPRPHCYLAEALMKLNQIQPAERARQTAVRLSALLPLSLAECRSLDAMK